MFNIKKRTNDFINLKKMFSKFLPKTIVHVMASVSLHPSL